MVGDRRFLLFCDGSSNTQAVGVDTGATIRRCECPLEVGNAAGQPSGPQVTRGLVLGTGHGHAGLRV